MLAFVVFVIIGVYVSIVYLCENLKNPLLLIFYNIKSCLTHNEINLKNKYGDWAAITGSTDGIGKAYARELARRGINVILISRTLSKLQAVAEEIENEFNVETKIVVADFTHGQEICNHIEKELVDMPVRILINNVGHGEEGQIADCTAEAIWNVIHINIGSVTQLSRYFISRLRNSKQNGIIVNVSSGTALTAITHAATYFASKSYVNYFTLALQKEARSYGISVQLLSPFFVHTKINSYSKDVMECGGLLVPHPEVYACSAIKTLGKLKETNGFAWHGFQAALSKTLPWRVRVYLSTQCANLILSREKNGCQKWKIIILEFIVYSVAFNALFIYFVFEPFKINL